MPVAGAIVAAAVDLNGRGHYFHIGSYEIGLANLVVILLMILVFILALVVPFPKDKADEQ
jgi:hypothetical protein